ncbi:hypothetical protein E2C01_065222 [Portunus trituberculatus]|uniref:Uncharacterized protein n=1 Tax=Portunus trituberculatus TaxID=210409 RepID=A0A5B7HLY0_PORTR|nr:hypothetical protein [Portunus trituberculatus]
MNLPFLLPTYLHLPPIQSLSYLSLVTPSSRLTRHRCLSLGLAMDEAPKYFFFPASPFNTRNYPAVERVQCM